MLAPWSSDFGKNLGSIHYSGNVSEMGWEAVKGAAKWGLEGRVSANRENN